jgi:hypothetical protein
MFCLIMTPIWIQRIYCCKISLGNRYCLFCEWFENMKELWSIFCRTIRQIFIGKRGGLKPKMDDEKKKSIQRNGWSDVMILDIVIL